MKNIAIITQYFYPSYASTAQLMTDLAQGFRRQGYRVQVFTMINPSNIQTKSSEHTWNDIKITRSFSLLYQSYSIFSKIISSLFFLFQGFIYILEIDQMTPLLIASNPPYAGTIGLWFKFLKQGKYYFLLQDIFPESAVLSQVIKDNGILFKLLSQLIYWICLYSEATIVLSDSMKFFLEEKYPRLKEKDNIKVIENWAIENISPCDKENNSFAIQHDLRQIFTVLYSGNIGRLHDIESIAEAIKILKDKPIRFVFIGDGAKLRILERYQKDYQLSNLLLLPLQPREIISNTLTACDIALVSLIEGAEKIIAPCKLYGMLAAGRAIVSISESNSYIDKLLTNYHCGVNCPPCQPEKLAQIFMELANNAYSVKVMGEKARQLYEDRYTFDRAMNEYETILFK